MSPKVTGYVFVIAQACFLIALISLGGDNDWPTPGWLRAIGMLIIVGGLILVAAAAANLGPSLTPTPVPNDKGLKTTGLHAIVRHPIYAGVLLIVLGLVVRSGNFLSLAVGIATVSFFKVKADFEERQLKEHYAEYEAYAASTPQFVPGLGPKS